MTEEQSSRVNQKKGFKSKTKRFVSKSGRTIVKQKKLITNRRPYKYVVEGNVGKWNIFWHLEKLGFAV